jgi:hypothetical protein
LGIACYVCNENNGYGLSTPQMSNTVVKTLLIKERIWNGKSYYWRK